MATKKVTNTAAATPAAASQLQPVHIVYHDVDFGIIQPRVFADQRFRMLVTLMQRAAKAGDTSAGMDNELRMYEMLFGADNVDDVFDKLADINDGFVGVEEMRAFVTFIMEETKAKNS